jgi:ABC-type polysaccharide/polyol phosphate export permease
VNASKEPGATEFQSVSDFRSGKIADPEIRVSPRKVTVVRSGPPTLRSALRLAFEHKDLLRNLIGRDLRTRYRGSAFGWGWSLMNPLMTTATFSFAFRYVFDVQAKAGDPSGLKNFALFLLSGLLPWLSFNASVTQGIGALLSGSSMMGKVNFAREHLVLGSVMANIVTFCVELVVLAGILTVVGYPPVKVLPVVLLLVVLHAMFSSGMALLLAALNVRYRDTQHFVGIAFGVLFYLTPIVYAPSLLGSKAIEILGLKLQVRDIAMASPIAQSVTAFRTCLYDGRYPSFSSLGYLSATSVASLLAGYTFFIRRSPRFIEDM